MCPIPAGSDVVDCLVRNTKPTCQEPLAPVAQSRQGCLNQANLIFSQSCQIVIRAFLASLPSLGTHVSHVVGVGAEEQVVRPHALPVVATVADAEPFPDWPNVQFVAESVGSSR